MNLTKSVTLVVGMRGGVQVRVPLVPLEAVSQIIREWVAARDEVEKTPLAKIRGTRSIMWTPEGHDTPFNVAAFAGEEIISIHCEDWAE